MNFLYLFCALFMFVSCELMDEEEVIVGDGGTIVTQVEDDVLILTHDNFDLQVAKDIILVEFYAPWCGHCQRLAPEYAKAANMLKDSDPPIPLAKVDGTVETDLASRYEVTGFPTLFVFRNGKNFPYEGPRTAMGIVEYMKQQADPNWKPPPEAVMTLTSDNFTSIIPYQDIILVEFYAPWCGHCKRLAPVYERAAKALKNLPKPIPCAKVDATVEKKLAKDLGVTGYPTLMIFRKGAKYDYRGPSTEQGIVAFMKKHALPPTKEVSSAKSLRSYFDEKDVTIVGFFHDEEDPLFLEYVKAGNDLRDKFTFYHTFSEDIAKEFEVQPSDIVVFQPELFASEYEPTRYALEEEESTAWDIKGFIRDHSVPLVGQRSAKNNFQYAERYPLVVVYYDVDFSYEHRVRTQMVRKEVTKVAKDYIGTVAFAISNEEDYQDELIDLGLDDSGEDVNVGFYQSPKIRYRMPPTESFSGDKLREFVENVLGGKVSRHIKSQPAPKTNKGPVITIVGSAFEDLVSKTDKDLLLEFYAPWCGHCKKLEPVYKKLAKAFADDERIVIGKIDATANDYPERFQVTGYPTIYYIPASDKNNAILYEGDRSLESLTEFVNQQLEKFGPKDDQSPEDEQISKDEQIPKDEQSPKDEL